MRKFWSVFIPIFCAILVFAGIVFNFVLKNSSTIYATKIEFEYDKLQLEVGKTYTLRNTEFVIEPQNCTERFWLSSTETEIVEIDSIKCEITAKQIGTCEIFANIKSGKNSTIATSFLVEIVPNGSSSINRISSQNLSFDFEDGYGIIMLSNYFTEPAQEYFVVEGGTNTTFELETDRLYVQFNACDSVVISVQSNHEKVIFYLTIE